MQEFAMEVETPGADHKEKKTRKRLRLSCVECTKRRQKCDRNYPCSLCVSRNVTHLCRWESVPMARPPPARPPVAAQKMRDDALTIKTLNARIAALEQALANKMGSENPPGSSPVLDGFSSSPQSTMTLVDNLSPCASPDPGHFSTRSSCSPEPALLESVIPVSEPIVLPLGQAIYDTTSTLAQLAFAHHGEYIGRGSLICALHSISSGCTPRFLYAKSTDSTSPRRKPTDRGSPATSANTVERLLEGIPPMPLMSAMINSYFLHVNWRFGIPEQWFREACSQMWMALKFSNAADKINVNWLSLLFAVLAYTPPDTPELHAPGVVVEGSMNFFLRAMNARRIVDEDHLRNPSISPVVSAADGTVLGCLALPLICNHLAERGLASEAWKLIGVGLRNAQAVGMHRDPAWKLWQIMSEDEKLLRRRAWWSLVVWDRMYSFILGRPQMLRQETFDVIPPCSVDANGKRDLFNFCQVTMIQLSRIICEASEKCFGVEYPDCPVFLELDYKFKQWEEQLPPEYQFQQKPHSGEHALELDAAEQLVLARQRYMLTTWYLVTRMKLHIAAVTGQGRAPQPPMCIKECVRHCISLALKLGHFQCDTYDARGKSSPGDAVAGSNWFFEGCFTLFEAGVALMAVLTRYPWPDKTAEAKALVARAEGVFARVVREEEGLRADIARMGVEVLGLLQQEHWWGREHRVDAVSESKDGARSPLDAFQSTFGAVQGHHPPVAGFLPWYSGLVAPGVDGHGVQYSLSAIRTDQGVRMSAVGCAVTEDCKDMDMYI